jgi:hypothetical protein
VRVDLKNFPAWPEFGYFDKRRPRDGFGVVCFVETLEYEAGKFDF